MFLQIVGSNPEEQQKMYGRHFDIDDELVSHISRKSIDVLKANYRVREVSKPTILFFKNYHLDWHSMKYFVAAR